LQLCLFSAVQIQAENSKESLLIAPYFHENEDDLKRTLPFWSNPQDRTS
jgi:hypothetical protein